jgi:hypothetical protein
MTMFCLLCGRYRVRLGQRCYGCGTEHDEKLVSQAANACIVLEYKPPRARKWRRIQYAINRSNWAKQDARVQRALGCQVKPLRVDIFIAPAFQRL